MPNQPAFSARSTSLRTLNGSPFIFDTAMLNIGNHYNTATGRFTAPIAGVYHFFVEFLANDTNTDTVDTRFYVNGVMTQNGSTYAPSTGSYRKVLMSSLIQLSANDVVDVRTQSGGSNGVMYGDSTGGTAHSNLKGYLLG